MRSPARHRRRTITATLAGAVTALAFAPLPAQADFTLPHCGGESISGIGASFQAAAQTLFTEQFNVAQPNGCGGNPTITEYKADGSGAGRQALVSAPGPRPYRTAPPSTATPPPTRRPTRRSAPRSRAARSTPPSPT